MEKQIPMQFCCGLMMSKQGNVMACSKCKKAISAITGSPVKIESGKRSASWDVESNRR